MSKKKSTESIPADRLALYEKLLEAVPEVVQKANFGFPYTALNGNMYSFISKTGTVAIRLPKKERETFLERFGTILFLHESGTVLKEYVTVPDALLEDTQALAPYLEASHQYALTLKPKPAAKKAASGA